MGYIPERGDAVWLDFDPQAGHKQRGRRPAFVLSPASYNKKVGLMVVCPITTKVKGYPFEVVISEPNTVNGAILADHVKSLDWKVRRAEKMASLPASVIDEVLKKLRTLL